jgi:vitamin B12 transporter
MFFDAFPRRLSAAVFALAAPGALHAQAPSDTVTVPAIVVTATRLPTPAGAVAPTVTVLRGEALRAQGIRTVADALRAVPGASVVTSGAFGAQTSVFLRGGESDYVKVLVDGVAVNQPGGAFNWANLTLDNVERIEVLRGPASVLYGSDAVTGVVQIFTRRGSPGRDGLAAGVEAGRYGARHWTAEASGGSPVASYSVALSRFASDGLYPYNNGYRSTVVSGLLHAAPDARTEATLSVRYTDAAFHFPTDGGGRLTDRNQFNYDNGPALGLELGRFLTPRLEARVQLSASQTDGGYENPPDDSADTRGTYRSQDNLRRAGADVRANLYLSPVTILTVGLSAEQEREHSIDFCTSSFGDCSSPPVDTSRANRAAYVQAVTGLGARVALNGGVRVEDNQRFGTFATYRVGAVFRVSARTRLRLSAGTAFKEPTFFENYATGFVKGNPSLKPEQSRAIELGVERELWDGRLIAGVTGFVQRFRNMVDFTFSPPDPADPNYFNVAAARADGAELTLTLRPLPRLTLSGSYTYLETEVTTPGLDPGAGAAFLAGQPLLRRPAHSAGIDAALALGAHVRVDAAVRYVGTRTDQDFGTFPSPRLTFPSYACVDLGGSVSLRNPGAGSPGLEARARVENLLDRRYEEVKGFPARRRALFVGVQLSH